MEIKLVKDILPANDKWLRWLDERAGVKKS
jgi:hypothetical protein